MCRASIHRTSAATGIFTSSEYGVNSWENFKTVLRDEVTIEIVVEANAGYQLARALVCLFE
ncbi:MAG: hypothetical protein VX656_10575, partial [Candidatus Latescibacterota bacterium]|nr:hypothetical protein [Candidatus Latescibacterota bacterium]